MDKSIKSLTALAALDVLLLTLFFTACKQQAVKTTQETTAATTETTITTTETTEAQTETTTETEPETETELEYIEEYTEEAIEYGNRSVFTITAYCPCEQCCGKSDGITASGTVATAGRTIAVNPNEIPYGTAVIINGHTYIAEDCGGGIGYGRIDIFFDTHQEALNWGCRELEVEIIGGEEKW